MESRASATSSSKWRREVSITSRIVRHGGRGSEEARQRRPGAQVTLGGDAVERRAVLARIGPAFQPETWRRLRDRFARLRRGRFWRVAAVVLAGIAGGWVGLAVGGQVLTPIGPADVNLGVSPSWRGETVINIAPLGKLAFDTHAAPLRFEATIAEIRLTAAEEMVQNPETIPRRGASIVADVKQGAGQCAGRAVRAAAGAAAVVG